MPFCSFCEDCMNLSVVYSSFSSAAASFSVRSACPAERVTDHIIAFFIGDSPDRPDEIAGHSFRIRMAIPGAAYFSPLIIARPP